MSGGLLLVRSGKRFCGFPLQHVEETMRPLPIEPFPSSPAFVRGVAVIREEPTPIVDLALLLGDERLENPARLVTLRVTSARRVGLLVDEVRGIVHSERIEAVPPLLQDAARDAVQALGRLDEKLLTVLKSATLLPDELWATLRKAAP